MPAATAVAASSSSADAAASLGKLSSTIPAIFQQAQLSLANHRKNMVALHRLHVASAAVQEQTVKGTRLVGEKAFNDAFLGCLNRVLGIKKGVPNADRCVKFVAAYCGYAQEQFRRSAAQDGEGENDEDEEEADTPATRFATILLRHLLRGFGAKNKNVRLRCCQTAALLINGLESIDDDLYVMLKDHLLIRMRDREAPVRVQAIIAMAKLQGGEAEDDQQDDEEGPDYEDEERQDVTSLIVRALRHDPSADVRRAALFNLVPTRNTLPYILERLRDVDTVNRRCVYLGSLSNAVLEQPTCQVKPDEAEWAHVVKVGLGERESSVLRAVKKLIASWVDADKSVEVENVSKPEQLLVKRFNLTTDVETARSALLAAFEVRPALLDSVSFDQEFWTALTPCKALIARVFAEHCKTLAADGEKRMEEAMPLVTALAFHTQAAWGALLQQLEVAEDELEDDAMDIAAERESIVESLLHVTMHLDYGDEIGRRKMFGLVRDMVRNALLPEVLIGPCLDVLRKLSAGQKDFVRIIVELVQEIEDVVDAADAVDDSDEDEEAEIEEELVGKAAATSKADKKATPDPEQAAAQACIDARRLSIISGMLERVVGGMQENTAMHGLVSQLIAPAVRSKDAVVRARGLHSLGLCCLLDAKLALSTFGLFLQQTEQGEGAIRKTSIEIVFDQLTTHGISYLCQPQIHEAGGGQDAVEEVHAQIVNFLLSLLEDDEEQIQAIAAEGMAKLMLSGVVADDDALRSLILVYMSPETSENQQLRQCLSYFLPIYCYSSAANQRRLQRVFVPILDVLTEVYYEREVEQEMVSPVQVGLQLLDWCDPVKGVYKNKEDITVHIDVAIEMIQALFVKQAKDDRKVLCQLLGKLSLPDGETLANGIADEMVVVTALFILIGTLQKVRPLEDAASRNNLAKFQLTCKRLYPSVWTHVQEMDMDDAAELEGVREFLRECGYEPSKMLDKGDDGRVIAAEPRRPSSAAAGSAASTAPRFSSSANSRRMLSAATSRSASGATSRKTSTGTTPVPTSRTSRVKVESDDEGPTLEESIMEEDEDDGDDATGTFDGSRLAAVQLDDFDSL